MKPVRERVVEIVSDLSLAEIGELIEDLETLIKLKQAKIARLKKTLDNADKV